MSWNIDVKVHLMNEKLTKKELEEKLTVAKRNYKAALHYNDNDEIELLGKEVDDLKFQIAYYKEDEHENK